MRLILSFSICLLVLLVLGCDGNTAGPLSSEGTGSGIPTEGAIAPEKIKLTIGDEKLLEAMIAAHKGKVVFVDYWATWCHPCVEYFPHTVEMSHKYKEQGLETIAVSFDELEDEAKAREFLAGQGADFENLLSKYGVGTEANEAFGIEQVPHFRLYDRKGELRHKWDAKPEDADEKIKELLQEST